MKFFGYIIDIHKEHQEYSIDEQLTRGLISSAKSDVRFAKRNLYFAKQDAKPGAFSDEELKKLVDAPGLFSPEYAEKIAKNGYALPKEQVDEAKEMLKEAKIHKRNILESVKQFSL